MLLCVLALWLAWPGTVLAQMTRSNSWNPAADRNTGALQGRMGQGRMIIHRDQRVHRLLPGQTLVNASYTSALRRELEDRVMHAEVSAGPANPLRILDTRVIGAAPAADLTSARWSELWTVQRGKGQVQYRIQFTGEGRGRGITFRADRRG